MGNTSHQYTSGIHSLLNVTTVNNKSLYINVDHPQDPYLTNKLEEIRSNHEFEECFSIFHLMKKKDEQTYYLGDWDQSGIQKGKGILYRPTQFIYYGYFDLVPHGVGVLQSIACKYKYEGQFFQGKNHGKCRIEKDDKLYKFEGIINDQKQPVQGKLTVNKPTDGTLDYTVILDNYPTIKARIIYSDGRQYEGSIDTKTFLPHGEGHSRYPNNSFYDGNWIKGQFDGEGIFTWADGSFYKGNYIKGQKQGHGRFTYLSQKVYDGQWISGKQNGEGILYDSQGNILKKGLWKDGIFETDKL